MRIIARKPVLHRGRKIAIGQELPANEIADVERLVARGVVEVVEAPPRGSDDPDAGKHLNPPPPGHGQIDLTAFEAPAKRPRSR